MECLGSSGCWLPVLESSVDDLAVVDAGQGGVGHRLHTRTAEETLASQCCWCDTKAVLPASRPCSRGTAAKALCLQYTRRAIAIAGPSSLLCAPHLDQRVDQLCTQSVGGGSGGPLEGGGTSGHCLAVQGPALQ